jgi:uncharacterized protein YdaU (DUF1376 family)
MSSADGMMLWTNDYLADTSHLTTVQHGAYLLLLICMWRAGGSLPNDDRLLARYTGLPLDKWRKVSPEVRALLTVEGDRITQKRLELEFKKTSGLIEKRRSSGRVGGDAKSQKTKEAKLASASNLPEQKPAVAPETKTETRKERSSEAKASGAGAPDVSRETLFSEQQAPPVYTDTKHEVWTEGVLILVSLGMKEAKARSMIGLWMKTTKDDAVSVLGAIQRARDNRVGGPVEWITRALQPENNHERTGKNRTPGPAQSRTLAQDTLIAGMASALSERPDSRLGTGDAGRRREGSKGDPNDNEELGPVALCVPFD